ncbi:hypothetical protein [Dyadobacter sediminis]|uniref:Lipocalin-like domain-containing protein n=1 Tax=Dyadobacter sediminis TaxID=1493691 RepID=A0A5R9KBK8_9BACT|nr:hypothetical protein [Dyadobacter sediminis]TLU92210.1 hypothetical protein FEM55_15835 [Dyadobacter sediminis]GGB96508.1 hypothetical protein GCM10011325_24790 [Dyadobacter sediminis]
MKKTLFILTFLAFVQCRESRKVDPEPLPEIASIAGKWRVIAYSRASGDSLITDTVTTENAAFYVFRYDGVLVNENGYRPCCLPQNYFLNENFFEAKPLKPVESDPACQYVYCGGCPEMTLTTPTADNLLMETCKGTYTSLVREK